MNITERRPFGAEEILVEEFMEPLGLSQGELAARLHLSRRRINEICNGRRGITPDTAVRRSRAFGTSPELWLNLQAKVGLWDRLHDERLQAEYREIVRIESAA